MPSLVQEVMYKEITNQFEKNPYIFVSTFQGITVADLSDLRRHLEKVAKRSVVVKHSIAKKVLSELQLNGAEDFFKNNTLVTFGDKDPQAISKALVDFAKANNKLVPEGVLFEKKVYGKDYVKALAQLPSRQELLTQVVVRVQSPLSGLVTTLNRVVSGVVVAINEIRKQKEAVATA